MPIPDHCSYCGSPLSASFINAMQRHYRAHPKATIAQRAACEDCSLKMEKTWERLHAIGQDAKKSEDSQES